MAFLVFFERFEHNFSFKIKLYYRMKDDIIIFSVDSG